MTALTEPTHCAARTNSCPHTMVIKKARLAATLIFGLLLSACSWSATHRKTSAATSDFQEVESLIQQHRFAEAKTATLDLLQRHPSSVEGYNFLGIIQTDQQDYPAALASFQNALRLNPRSTKTHNNIANVYVAQQQPDLAENEYRAVLRLDPANSEANYNLGVLLMMKGSPSSAIQHFARVHPMNTAARFNLVRAYFKTKRTSDALRVAAELSEQNKNEVQVHFSLGVLLASEKEYKTAQLELERADALQPETFEIIYNLGQVFLRNADYSKAQVILNRGLKLKPESPETMYLLAQAYTNQSRPLDALDLLLRAHKLAPDNTDVIFLMAQVSMSQNYFEDAIPLLEEGLQIAPKRPDLLAALGESYFMSGKVEKAIEEFKKLVEIENSARSYAFLGLSYRNLGRFDDAKQYFQQGLKLDPHMAPACSILDSSPSAKATLPGQKNSFSDPCAPTRIFPTHCLSSQIYESPRESFLRPRTC
jgi:cytochrome c-type biogenesis protein CcmH/NrfG